MPVSLGWAERILGADLLGSVDGVRPEHETLPGVKMVLGGVGGGASLNQLSLGWTWGMLRAEGSRGKELRLWGLLENNEHL